MGSLITCTIDNSFHWSLFSVLVWVICCNIELSKTFPAYTFNKPNTNTNPSAHPPPPLPLQKKIASFTSVHTICVTHLIRIQYGIQYFELVCLFQKRYLSMIFDTVFETIPDTPEISSGPSNFLKWRVS